MRDRRHLDAIDPKDPSRSLNLYIEDEDVRDLVDGPRHHFHELVHVVPQVLRKPACKAIFEGLRTDGDLVRGLAYCGRPSCAYDNSGARIPPREGKCFVVFVNDENAIFDWDWIPADDSGATPIDADERFREMVWREVE